MVIISLLKCLEKIESKTPESKEQAGSPISGRSLHSKQSYTQIVNGTSFLTSICPNCLSSQNFEMFLRSIFRSLFFSSS